MQHNTFAGGSFCFSFSHQLVQGPAQIFQQIFTLLFAVWIGSSSTAPGSGCLQRAPESLQRQAPEVPREMAHAEIAQQRIAMTVNANAAICGFGALHKKVVLQLCRRYSLGMGINYQQLLKNVPMGAGSGLL